MLAKASANSEIRHCNDDPSSLYTYKAEVARVVDADTFLLTIDTGFDNWLDSRVRLRGIDAPEISTAAGRRAYRYVKKALGLAKLYKDPSSAPVKPGESADAS